VANYEHKQNAVIRPMWIVGEGNGSGEGNSLVSKVADEANSELLNTEEVSKPNRTPFPCIKSPKLKSN
jgi:hypothetical protein